MAERSFSKEVLKLRLGQGQQFRGEGILAVTKALLQSGVSYVGGYQGAPISHLMDVLSDADEILRGLGIHFEHSASEATAAAMLGWLLTERIRDGHATSLGAASGIVAGLVAITPSCSSVNVVGALAIGAGAGILCALAVGQIGRAHV